MGTFSPSWLDSMFLFWTRGRVFPNLFFFRPIAALSRLVSPLSSPMAFRKLPRLICIFFPTAGNVFFRPHFLSFFCGRESLPAFRLTLILAQAHPLAIPFFPLRQAPHPCDLFKSGYLRILRFFTGMFFPPAPFSLSQAQLAGLFFPGRNCAVNGHTFLLSLPLPLFFFPYQIGPILGFDAVVFFPRSVCPRSEVWDSTLWLRTPAPIIPLPSCGVSGWACRMFINFLRPLGQCEAFFSQIIPTYFFPAPDPPCEGSCVFPRTITRGRRPGFLSPLPSAA